MRSRNADTAEKVKALTDKLETGVKAVFESEQYKAYMKAMAKFHRYSFNNVMLILMQCPNATAVAGFNTWKKQFGRTVKKGESGIQILAPVPYKRIVESVKLDPVTKAPVLDANGKPVSKNKVYQLRDGLFEAIADRFYKDPTMVAYGEENRDWGGAFAVYRGLTEALPYHRLFNAPISESAIVGSAVGYAMAGGRALVELMYCDFLGCAGDEVFNQMAKWQAMSADIIKMPVVLRVSVGSKYGAQHSQDWTALVAHIPGLKAAFPTTPYDAKGMLAAALAGTDPVIFFESQRIYDVGEQFHEGGVPAEYYEIPFGKADIKRPGKDITILTFGAVMYRALKAADELKEKYGMEAEVIDARSLVPFDYDTVLESVKKTGRLVIVTDACERGSFASEVARQITEMAFDYLDAAPTVVASRNWITPAHELEESFFPQPSWILDAIDAKIVPLKGHVRTTNQTLNEKLRNERRGV